MSIFETDIWRIGIVKAPVEDVIACDICDIHWIKEEDTFKFLADPFGLYRDNKLYVFAEAYDYRDRHGRIEVLILDQQLSLIDRKIVLEKPWHLSYPMLIEDQGLVYMLPEAYKSGGTSLYKAVEFPFHWEKVSSFSFPEVAIDPTVLFYNDLWWMFYTPVREGLSRQSVLSVAWSESLAGTWHSHSLNPVRISPSSARPGGNAVITSQGIILPTQDCSLTYGGGLTFLNIIELTPDQFEARITGQFNKGSIFGEYNQGVHTLSKAGPYSLIDGKKILRQPVRRFLIDMRYQIHGIF